MRKLLFIAALAPLLTLSPVDGSRAAAAPHTIKVATILPQGGPWAAELARFAADVKRLTKGQVIFKLYFGAVAGTDTRALGRMRTGQIQGVVAATASLSSIVPTVRVMDLPLLFKSYKEFWYVLRSMQPEFAQRYDRKGYKLVALAGIGWVYLFSKKPMTSVSDIANRRIWRWKADPIAAELFKLVGTRGQLLPPSEVLPSLQAGSLDTVYGMPHIAQALQWHTTLSYMLDLKITMATAGVLIRKSDFNRLSAAQQKIVLDRAKIMQRRLNKSSRRVNQKAKRAMIRSGIKAQRPAGSFLQHLLRLKKKVWRRLRGKLFQPADLKKIKALLTLCRNTSCRS